MGQAMRRRDFIQAIAVSTTWPLAARAQQSSRVFRIGFLGVSRDAPGTAEGLQAFSNELEKNGFSDGQNLTRPIEFRWAEGHYPNCLYNRRRPNTRRVRQQPQLARRQYYRCVFVHLHNRK
jgi:hypothetical protein